MKVVEQSVKILDHKTPFQHVLDLRLIERAARVCYKSEDKIGSDTDRFLTKIIESGHLSVLEHISVTCHIICDIGTARQLMRHRIVSYSQDRIASYSQESTRYCNYSKGKFGSEITVIRPRFKNEKNEVTWRRSVEVAEQAYLDMIENGESPEDARSVLPMCLKTELVMTTNLREWLYIIGLRTSPKAQAEIRLLVTNIQKELRKMYAVIFKKGV